MESFNIDHLEITPVQEQNQILPTLECCDFFNINFCYTRVAKTFGKPTVTTSNQSFYVPCDLLCEFGEFPMIHDLLPSMDIPPELLDVVLPQLVSTAKHMLTANSQRCRCGMLTLVVKLAVTSTPSTDASSFVDSLEKLKVDDASCCEANRCTIYLNKFCLPMMMMMMMELEYLRLFARHARMFTIKLVFFVASTLVPLAQCAVTNCHLDSFPIH